MALAIVEPTLKYQPDNVGVLTPGPESGLRTVCGG